MNKKLIITIAVLVLSLASLLIFKANWGIDYADAKLVIVSTDNSALTDNIFNDAAVLPDIARVERIDSNKLYLYFQPLSDNVDTQVNTYAAKYNLTSTDNMIYRFSSEEFTLITSRVVTLAMIVVFILFFYQGIELRNHNWKRFQVGYYIVTDFFVTAGVALVLFGIGALLGQLGLKMDDPFVVTVGLALGITLIYRLYEVEMIKRAKINEKDKVDSKEIKTVFHTRKPELILVSCVLTLAGFMPLVVLAGQLTVMSFLVALSIIVNYLTAIYIKPGLVAFMFKQAEATGFLKKKAFEKEW